MAKPRKNGMFATFIPNAKADMRFRKKVYQRGREIAEREPYESRAARRERRELERMKGQ
jgi:hypothetical protein